MTNTPEGWIKEFDKIFGQFFVNVKEHHYGVDLAVKAFIRTTIHSELESYKEKLKKQVVGMPIACAVCSSWIGCNCVYAKKLITRKDVLELLK